MATHDAPTSTTHRRRGIGSLLLAGTAGAAVVAVVLVAAAETAGYEIAGLEDPGVLTRYGVVVVRVLATVSSVVCVGSLLLAAFLVPPQRSGLVDVDGYAALRMAGHAAWVWFASALAAVVFTAADVLALPVADVLNPRTFMLALDAVEQPKAWLVTSLVALVVAVGCRVVLSWGGTVGVFLVAVFGLMPVAVTGHSASGGSHDVATNSLLYHVVAAALWVGGLAAVLALGVRRSRTLSLAARRFSRLALVCWVVLAVSGMVNALVRISPGDLLGSGYGRLVLAKIAALLVLGVVGYQQRSRSVRALTEHADGRALVRLASVEVLLMLVTIGIAIGLGRTPPPDAGTVLPSTLEVLIGYDLDGAPTLARLALGWRFDLVYGTAAVVLAGLYLWGVHRLRRRGRDWPAGRTVAWLVGCLVVLLATSSGIGAYAPAMFSMHLVSHTLLSIIAPVLLVRGAPISLILRALPAAGDAPGPREWVTSFVRSPFCRLLTHPGVALGLLVGPYYLLYFAGVFGATVGLHWAHLAMNGVFLVAGYVLFWPLIGTDPAPRRQSPPARVGMMFALLPCFGFLAVVVMNMSTVIGGTFYRQLDLPWATDLLADQRLGGGIVWALGELPVLILLVATATHWARSDERDAARRDRGASGDDELAAYNTMLARLGTPDRPTRQQEDGS